MSAPVVPIEDDGPEEGEIEDDEDDVTLLSPQRSSTTSAGLDIHASSGGKYSFDEDIRHFERRVRAARSRRASGESKSTHSVGSSIHSQRSDSYTRTKARQSRTGSTHGKENRHIRHKSPTHRHRKESHDQTLIDFKDVSPIRRDSSCSSIESGDRTSVDRSSHHRSSRKCSRLNRTKRKSSSSPETHNSVKRRSRHSGKCPLIKALQSVAKETRRAMDSENNTESSSLRQRLLNMGVMPACPDNGQSSREKESSSIEAACATDNEIKGDIQVEKNCKPVQSESTQTEDVVEKTAAFKQDPDIIFLSDSEEGAGHELQIPPQDSISGNMSKKPEDKAVLTANACLALPTENMECSTIATSEGGDDEDDIGRLRLIALQSKKNEPTPAEEPDASEEPDVLQLRLEALKTAFMKKFKTRKKISFKINKKPCNDDPLSPLDEIPMPFLPPSHDEVMTPVDMELAETDDEDTSIHSVSCYSPSDPIPDLQSPSGPLPDSYVPSDQYVECYSPSDPTESPTREPSLRDLLPPPPPPDLDLYLTDQNFENSMRDVNEDAVFQDCFASHIPATDMVSPPPLPPYFRDLLADIPDVPFSIPTVHSVQHQPSHLTEIPDSSIHSVDMTECPQEHCSSKQKECILSKDDERPAPCIIPLNTGSAVSTVSSEAPLNPAEDISQPVQPPMENFYQQLMSTNDNANASLLTTIPAEDAATSMKHLLLKRVAILNRKERNLVEVKLTDVVTEEYSTEASEETHSRTVEKLPNRIVEETPRRAEKPTPKTSTEETAIRSTEESVQKSQEETPKKSISLEEEEKLLRKRLLLNMAMKRGNLLQKKVDQQVVAKTTQGAPDILSLDAKGAPLEGIARGTGNGFDRTKQIAILAEASTVKLKPSSLQPLAVLNLTSDVKRLVINLGEDSDSNDDYSEAEALGQKCTKNKEYWRLLMQRLDANPPEAKPLVRNSSPVAVGKLPVRGIVKVKQAPKERIKAKPFEEKISDLETSVERFLKGVRSSHEAISKTSKGSSQVSSHATPVAVKHLPASQQEEYRRLKQQIARLERHKSMESRKQEPSTIPKGTQIINSSQLKNSKDAIQSSKSILSPSTSSSKPLLDAIKSQRNVLSQSKPSSPKLPVLHRKSVLPVSPKNSISELSLKASDMKTKKDVSVSCGSVAVPNVSNLNAGKKRANGVLVTSRVQSVNGQSNELPQSQHLLLDLESSLIMGRSNVLSELSGLAKLLSQVDKSLEAQSHTAGEVSSLIDKLCLAAGRWRVQNRTVAVLVKKVVQRQQELSLRNRRCVAITNSCVALGSKLHGKNYRVPGDKADATRLHLNQVHEKTRELAKRRTIEQERKSTLEKRAENCLEKLFSDTKTTNSISGNTLKTSEISANNASSLMANRTNVHTATNSKPTDTSSKSQNESTSAPKPRPTKTLEETCQDGNTCIIARKPSTQLSSVISRAVTCRIALNKVRFAKTILNLTSRKCLRRKKDISKQLILKTQKRDKDCRYDLSDMDISTDEIKCKGNSKDNSTNAKIGEEESKHDLSDMDISTDGEEADRRNRDTASSTDVVDMAVSPDTSLSPSGNEKELTDNFLGGSSVSSNQNPSCLKIFSGMEEPLFADNAANSISNESNPNDHQKSSISNDKISTRNVLKKYVSPLGGLSVFSCSNVKAKTQEVDLYAILCPYDLNGKCQDSDCPYKH